MKNKIETTGFVCAFPGCGKSTIHKNALEYGLYTANKDGYTIYPRTKTSLNNKIVYDSDSSTFDKSGFPDNYIAHMISILHREVPFPFLALVSSHEEVRNAMKAKGIPYTLVYPDRSLKDEFIERYKVRGDSKSFIDLMDKNWDSFIDSCEKDTTYDKKILKSGQFLKDVL